MDATKFDAVVRRFAHGLTRRMAVRGLAAGALTAVTGGLDVSSAAAANNGRCKKAGSPCTKSQQCCPKDTKMKCAVASNAGNSDTTCCGGAGATCGGQNGNGDARAPFCCAGFDCAGRTCRRAA